MINTVENSFRSAIDPSASEHVQGAQLAQAHDSSLAPDPVTQTMLGDDAIYEIATLLAQSACDDRKSERKLRAASEKSVEEQTANRIAALREKADAVRTAALVGGATGMAAGACQVAGGLSSMSEASKIQTSGPAKLATNEETKALSLSRELSSEQAAQNSIVNHRASAYGQIGGGAGGFVQSSGSLVSAFLDHEAQDLEGDAEAHQAQAGRAQRSADDHDEAMRDAKEFMNKIMEFLRDVQSSRNAAAQNAMFRG